jgi:hypothetical protein
MKDRSAAAEEAPPHNGRRKLVKRFGSDVMKFVNSPVRRELHLLGVNARIVRSGRLETGCRVTRVHRGPTYHN